MKKINFARILARLSSRFKLSEMGQNETFTFSEQVVPTTNVDDLLAEAKTNEQTANATNVSHTWTVPAGKVWKINKVLMYRANAAECYVYVTVSGTTTYYARNTSTGILDVPFYNLRVKAGDVIGARHETGTSGIMISTIHYDEEDIF